MAHITTMQAAFERLSADSLSKPIGRTIAKRLESRIKFGKFLDHQRAVAKALIDAEKRLAAENIQRMAAKQRTEDELQGACDD
ncbi:MAG: hypothetical protein KGI54_17420 [Pseudomonadota bacterium]|nr:hypothetical protein [Pseudomonadota bacterium]